LTPWPCDAFAEARTAFLDLEPTGEIAEPTHTGREIDMTPEPQQLDIEDVSLRAAPPVAVPMFELI